MIKLSASSIRDFLKCSKMYYYRKSSPEESIDTQEATTGRIVHEVLEKHWDSDKEQVELAEERIKECNIDAYGEEKIMTCLETYRKQIPDIRKILKPNDRVEFYFSEQLTWDVCLVGKMDRVVTDDESVIDWKTGRTKNFINNDIQFIVYYTMYKKIFGKYPRGVYQVNLSSAKVSSFQPDKEYINTLFNSIIPMIVERTNKRKLYKEGYFNGSCYNCSFIGVCSKDR
jgi:CRISPR/Cas system-associated exonuclease Cas4 (RecB family)